jgi:hypothetical protein
MSGEGDEYGCTAWAYDLATQDKLEGPKVTLSMAKNEGWVSKAGSKWKTMPELMFRYRSAAFFGRLYAPDILMGMQTAEEVFDAVQVQTPTIEEVTELYEAKKDGLTEEEIIHCERIINNQEEKSYLKLLKTLQSK